MYLQNLIRAFLSGVERHYTLSAQRSFLAMAQIFRFFSTLLFAVVFAPLFFPSVCAYESARPYFNIVENGKVHLDIIVSENASQNEILAARYLRDNLCKISKSANINILKNGKFSLKNRSIILKNNNDHACRRNCAPSKDAQSFQFEISRDKISISYGNENDACAAVGIFLRRHCKIKIFAPSRIGKEFEVFDSLKILSGREKFSPSYAGRLLGMDSREEFEYAKLNGDNSSYYENGHNLVNIFNKPLLKKFPDWFAKRSIPNSDAGTLYTRQLDFLNRHAQNYAAEYAVEYFDKYPQKYVLSLGFADSHFFDQRRASLEMSRGINGIGYRDETNSVFTFTNFVAAALKKAHPNKLAMQISYLYTERPPSFDIEDNILVYLCMDTANAFSQKWKTDKTENIRQWRKVGADFLGLRDYYYGQPYFVPRQTEIISGKFIEDFHREGGRFFACESNPVWAYDACKMWVLSNILLDANSDAETLAEEFYSHYYRESSTQMREFFAIARDVWENRKDSPRWLKLYKRWGQAQLFSNGAVSQMEKHLLSAEESARADVVKIRVGEVRMMFDITKSFISQYETEREMWKLFLSAQPAQTGIIDLIEQYKLLQITKKTRIKILLSNTKYPKPDFSIWNSLPNSDISENLAERILKSRAPDTEKLKILLGEEFLSRAKSLLGAKNIAKNSDFSEGEKNWIVYRTYDCFERIGLVDNDGKKSFKISSLVGASLSQLVDAKAGKNYAAKLTLSGAAQIGDTFYIQLSFCDADGNVIEKKQLLIPDGIALEKLEIGLSATAPKQTDALVCSFFSVNTAKNTKMRVENFKILESN